MSATFILRMREEALNSAAVNHPYLQAMRKGDFPDVDWAFKDFAYQYGFYSTEFIRCLSAVIDNLSSAKHKQTLLSNLAEERGNFHDVDLPPEVLESVVGQPHTSLYKRFQRALGIDHIYRENAEVCPVSLSWGRQFLELCSKDECVGVGAIGIGTELIVSRIYSQILEGLKAHSKLTPTQRVFFDLHSQCDDEHAEQLLVIAQELSQNQMACKKIEYGTQKAIEMRVTFWDRMLERAHNPVAPNDCTTTKVLESIEN